MPYLKKMSISFSDFPLNPHEHAVSLYCNGCVNHCVGCHNSRLKDPKYTDETYPENSSDIIVKQLELYAKRARTNKVVLLGGDPLSPYNFDLTMEIISKSRLEFVIYTGHDKEILELIPPLNNIIAVKCGKFDVTLRQDTIKNNYIIQFASANQELYKFPSMKLLTKNGIYAYNEGK